jgi:hypothetical protein
MTWAGSDITGEAAPNGGSASVLPDHLRHSNVVVPLDRDRAVPDVEQGGDRLETAGKLLVDLLPQPQGPGRYQFVKRIC